MSPAPPPVVQSYVVPSFAPTHAPPVQHVSQFPPAYAPNRPSQAPPAHGGPSHAPAPSYAAPQHFAQPSFPPHFAPPTRAMPSTPPPPNVMAPRSSAMPMALRTGRASAFPSEEDLFVPDETSPPPNLMATCVVLGGPLLLATMVVAVLALR